MKNITNYTNMAVRVYSKEEEENFKLIIEIWDGEKWVNVNGNEEWNEALVEVWDGERWVEREEYENEYENIIE